jgi:hypothetical protein
MTSVSGLHHTQDSLINLTLLRNLRYYHFDANPLLWVSSMTLSFYLILGSKLSLYTYTCLTCIETYLLLIIAPNFSMDTPFHGTQST